MDELSQFIDSNTGGILLNAPLFMPSQVFNFIMCMVMAYALRIIFERNTEICYILWWTSSVIFCYLEIESIFKL